MKWNLATSFHSLQGLNLDSCAGYSIGMLFGDDSVIPESMRLSLVMKPLDSLIQLKLVGLPRLS